MIRARIIEKYIKSSSFGMKRSGVEKIVHEERFFSSMEKFHEWYNTFKDKLWEDDPAKVDLVEGIYVQTEEVVLDDTTAPERVRLYATFRPDVSYRYAV